MDKPEYISPELIERYLRGELSAEEQQALREAAEKDPFLADALEGFDEARSQDVNVAAITERLDEKVAGNTGYKKSGVVIPMSIVWKVSAVAAAVLIVVGSVFIFNNINNQQELAEGPETPIVEERTESADEANETGADNEMSLGDSEPVTKSFEGGSAGLADSTTVALQHGTYTVSLDGAAGNGFQISYGKAKQEVNRFWYSPPKQEDGAMLAWNWENEQDRLDNSGYLALVFEQDAAQDDEILVAELEAPEEPMDMVEEEAIEPDRDQVENIAFEDANVNSRVNETGSATINDETVIAGNFSDKKVAEPAPSGGRTVTVEEKEKLETTVESMDALTSSSMAKEPAEPSAYDEYFAGNYKTAATKFEDIVKDKPSDLEAQYYLGLSQFNSNKLNKAISSFDEILAQPENLYTDGAIWYKAQSLIKKGKDDEALPLLEELSTRENSYKQSASEMMFDLDK